MEELIRRAQSLKPRCAYPIKWILSPLCCHEIQGQGADDASISISWRLDLLIRSQENHHIHKVVSDLPFCRNDIILLILMRHRPTNWPCNAIHSPLQCRRNSGSDSPIDTSKIQESRQPLLHLECSRLETLGIVDAKLFWYHMLGHWQGQLTFLLMHEWGDPV